MTDRPQNTLNTYSMSTITKTDFDMAHAMLAYYSTQLEPDEFNLLRTIIRVWPDNNYSNQVRTPVYKAACVLFNAFRAPACH